MGWFSKALGISNPVIERAIQVDDVYGDDWTGSWDSVMSVRDEQALRLVAVYSATSLIADMYASLPVDFVGSADGQRQELAVPAWWQRPDPRVSLFDWKHQLIVSLLLRGNAYGLVIRDAFGAVQNVAWIHPSKVDVDETKAFPVYRLNGAEFPHLNVAQGGDILHIAAYVLPGSCVGLSPVGHFKHQFEMARGALLTAQEWFDNHAVPGGILKSAAPLTASPRGGGAATNAAIEAKARFKASMKSGDPLVLDGNWSWESVSLSPEEAAFLDAIEASANQIAAMFRVEPEDVGGKANSSLKYSTVEGNQRKFNTRTLMSWVVRIEEAIRPLLDPGVVIKHNLDALARPNLLELHRTITEQLENGTLTMHEARRLLDRGELTPDERDEWMQRRSIGKDEDSAARLIQQIYLGVGKVITAPEARKILADAGVPLDPSVTLDELHASLPPSPSPDDPEGAPSD